MEAEIEMNLPKSYVYMVHMYLHVQILALAVTASKLHTISTLRLDACVAVAVLQVSSLAFEMC